MVQPRAEWPCPRGWAIASVAVVLGACPSSAPHATGEPSTSDSSPAVPAPAPPPLGRPLVLSWSGLDLDLRAISEFTQRAALPLVDVTGEDAGADLVILPRPDGAVPPADTAAVPTFALAGVLAGDHDTHSVTVGWWPIRLWVPSGGPPPIDEWLESSTIGPDRLCQIEVDDPAVRQQLGLVLTRRGPGAARRFLRDLRDQHPLLPPPPLRAEVFDKVVTARCAAVGPWLTVPGSTTSPLTHGGGGEAGFPIVAAVRGEGAVADHAWRWVAALRSDTGDALLRHHGVLPLSGAPRDRPPLRDAPTRARAVERLLVQVGLRPGIDDGVPQDREVTTR